MMQQRYLPGQFMSACFHDAHYECLQANGVAGKPTFSGGSTYFQTHANTAPEQGCTFSACTPFSGVRPSHAMANKY
jgi:hypothetical protein